MKAEKLERILERYPWLEGELRAPFSDQKPDHRKLEFVTIKKMDNLGQFGDARVKLQHISPGFWELTTWIILFRIGDERTLRGRYVAFPDNEDRQDEQTVTQAIQYINNWHKEYWEGKAPMEFVAVVKTVFRGQGSMPFPTRVTVYLFN